MIFSFRSGDFLFTDRGVSTPFINRSNSAVSETCALPCHNNCPSRSPIGGAEPRNQHCTPHPQTPSPTVLARRTPAPNDTHPSCFVIDVILPTAAWSLSDGSQPFLIAHSHGRRHQPPGDPRGRRQPFAGGPHFPRDEGAAADGQPNDAGGTRPEQLVELHSGGGRGRMPPRHPEAVRIGSGACVCRCTTGGCCPSRPTAAAVAAAERWPKRHVSPLLPRWSLFSDAVGGNCMLSKYASGTDLFVWHLH